MLDFDDFFWFAEYYGTEASDEGWDERYDLDASGVVDMDDFYRFAELFVQPR